MQMVLVSIGMINFANDEKTKDSGAFISKLADIMKKIRPESSSA